jgi:Rieske Fe-S protein
MGMRVTDRRGFLAYAAGVAGLLVSYGLLGAYAVAYLFPPKVRRPARRLFIGRPGDFAVGATRSFVDEKSRTLLIRATTAGVEAFDTRCPHLGCKVHWEAEKDRFFCPCHQGIFDRNGVAIAGPPFDAGQSLARAEVEADAAGNLYLKLET